MVKKKVLAISLLSSDEESGPPRKKRIVKQPSRAKKPVQDTGKQLLLRPTSAGDSRPCLDFTSSQPSQTDSRDQPKASQQPETKPAHIPAARGDHAQLWTEKHAPRTRDELVVHKDKVAAVASWLEQQAAPQTSRSSCCLLVTGPAGCGKTSTVEVLAREAGYDITEWHPPLPTLWHEHRYQGGLDVPYSSKMDEFDGFVAHAKMGSLHLGPSAAAAAGDAGTELAHQAERSMHLDADPAGGQSGSRGHRSLMLVDDLPHAQGPAQRKRLVSALGTLAATAQQPVVIIMGESGTSGSNKDKSAPSGPAAGAGAGNSAFSLPAEITGAVTRGGATHIQFNPLADTFAAKALVAVAEKEGLRLSKEAAKQCALQASGDLFHAIESLQLSCAGKPRTKVQASPAKKRGRGKAANSAAQLSAEDVMHTNTRDITLSIFRVLGKILYNKRLHPSSQSSDQTQEHLSLDESSSDHLARGLRALLGDVDTSRRLPMDPSLGRPPSEYNPEAIMLHGGLEANSVAAFLHENMLHFCGDDAVDEAASALHYLGDADRLLSHSQASPSSLSTWDADEHPSSSFAEAAAGSLIFPEYSGLATRGGGQCLRVGGGDAALPQNHGCLEPLTPSSKPVAPQVVAHVEWAAA
ncbi:hypothetical protein WJX73_004206 [Symbiochloris irregularis]|uniref:Cell cycle checkpoint protein RAD17 n=1 Tax=Symbiochloris irregularis TaxID=706552 RepID=A0AAW1PK37_9CHLO